MSILFSSDFGWIISHLNYLYSSYETVKNEEGNNVTLKFNETFFKVNSQYLRQSEIESLKTEENITSSKKRKRKKLQTLPPDILEQNNFVKETSRRILNEAKDLKLFTNTVTDNNEESRLESKKFYLDTPKLTDNYHGSNEQEIAIIAEFQNKKYVFPKNCKFFCYDIRDISEKFNVTNEFDLILLDPPWWNKSIRRKKIKFEESSYKMLYNDELLKIPIGSLLNSNGIVAVWCTNSSNHVKSIIEEMFPAWGVTFKAKWYWLKITQNGETICDFNELHGKQPYEQLIIGVVSSNLDFKLPDKKIIISIPSSVHSHKPPLTEIFQNYLPKIPKCMEIFARYLLPGWTSWGLEVLKFQHLSLYNVMKNKNIPEDNNTNR